MQLGVTLPTKELGADLSALRDYAQAAEDLGFDFLMGYDQLLGSPPAEPLVTHHGQFHDVQEVGINPRPPGGSIPIWIGTYAERTLERIGRLADGWAGSAPSRRRLAERRGFVDEAARRAGGDPSALGIHVQVDLLGFDLDRQLDYAGRVQSPHVPAARLDQGLPPPTGR